MGLAFAEAARLEGWLLFQLLSFCTWFLSTLLVQVVKYGFPGFSLNVLLGSICTGSVPLASAS